jgi:hypothetical protein
VAVIFQDVHVLIKATFRMPRLKKRKGKYCSSTILLIMNNWEMISKTQKTSEGTKKTESRVGHTKRK